MPRLAPASRPFATPDTARTRNSAARWHCALGGALALALGGLSAPAQAHPHVFVTAEMEVVIDAGQVQGVRLHWLYDDFFSFVLTSDLGIDLDGDMVLTAEEEEILRAAVLDWPEEYTGDLEIRQSGQVLPLGPRAEAEAAFTEGRVSERHLRPLDPAVPAPVEIAVFDPYFYIAYELAGAPRLVDPSGAEVTDCAAILTRADLEAAYAEVEEMTGRPAQDVGPDEDFPMVGAAFADRVIVTCGA